MIALVASCVVGSPTALATEVITIEQALGGSGNFHPHALGDNGDVVGSATFPGRNGLHPARWRAGVLTELAVPEGFLNGEAVDVNAAGVVVGVALYKAGIPSHAMKWGPTSAAAVDIGPSFSSGEEPESRRSVALQITDSGAIFGTADQDPERFPRKAVRFNAGGAATSLWDPGPAGHLCGGSRNIDLFSVSPDGTQALLTGDRDDFCTGDPWLVTAGNAVSLAACMADRASGTQALPSTVGDGSTVVGPGNGGTPVLWKAGTCNQLPVPAGAGGVTNGINSHGVVVGAVQDAQGLHGARWSADGTFGYIDDLLAENSPWAILGVSDINDDGWMLGGARENGEYRTVIVKPTPSQVPPDLDQAAPSRLSTYATGTGAAQRFRLAFRAAVDNVGASPLLINGHRKSTANRDMTADQLVSRGDGSKRTYPNVGALRFSDPNWLLRSFDHYELRRPTDYKLLRGRKAGFCLRDAYNSDPNRRLPGEPAAAQITSRCGLNKPGLLSLNEGLSVGFGVFSQLGQKSEFVDVKGIPAGHYYLVHRLNESHKIVEASYTNNASSLLIRLRWPDGTDHKPSVSVLKKCPNKARCPA